MSGNSPRSLAFGRSRVEKDGYPAEGYLRRRVLSLRLRNVTSPRWHADSTIIVIETSGCRTTKRRRAGTGMDSRLPRLCSPDENGIISTTVGKLWISYSTKGWMVFTYTITDPTIRPRENTAHETAGPSIIFGGQAQTIGLRLWSMS